MADNYYDMTGVLVVGRVTPIIRALFGQFELDEYYPGGGEAYIANVAGSTSPTWGTVFVDLADLAESIGVDVRGAQSEPDALGGLVELLWRFAEQFRSTSNGALRKLLVGWRHDIDDEPDLETLFVLAQAFDDGHQLKAIKVDAAWYCSKPRLEELGGRGTYIGRYFSCAVASPRAGVLGRAVNDALATNDVGTVVDVFCDDLTRLLNGICDASQRTAVEQLIAARLSQVKSIGG